MAEWIHHLFPQQDCLVLRVLWDEMCWSLLGMLCAETSSPGLYFFSVPSKFAGINFNFDV